MLHFFIVLSTIRFTKYLGSNLALANLSLLCKEIKALKATVRKT